MTPQTAREGLAERLAALHEALREFQQVLDDRPPDGDAKAIDPFTEAADEMLDWAADAAEVADGTGDPRLTFGVCHRRLDQIADRLAAVAAYRPVAELARFAREAGGEWPDWVRSARLTLERVRPPLRAASESLVGCWQAAADRPAR